MMKELVVSPSIEPDLASSKCDQGGTEDSPRLLISDKSRRHVDQTHGDLSRVTVETHVYDLIDCRSTASTSWSCTVSSLHRVVYCIGE